MSDQPDLFEVPEVLSPRLKWMREHGVAVTQCRAEDGLETEWIASLRDERNHYRSGRGATEAEAVEDLAGKMGFVNYERATR